MDVVELFPLSHIIIIIFFFFIGLKSSKAIIISKPFFTALLGNSYFFL